MKHLSLTDHPYFALLLVWRAVLGLFALDAVFEKPFAAMLMSLGVLGVFLLAGELAYKAKLRFDQERLRQERDRELRERRAEEARLRLEAARAQQVASARKGFGLDDDNEAPPLPVIETSDGVLGTLSAKDFALALNEAKI
ncbi:hypothetical protein [Dechloromonas sp. A34]|uniref:hypothetical protein n=1 Tax=Dechloromonas sp. A34 TaxID=447588 RepID=UPI00224982A0|nr:hypothetical protein [Dechloromonas sp. A34]